MTTIITAIQNPLMHSGETRNGAVSFDNLLETSPDEVITGTPTIVVAPSGLTISNIAVTSGSRVIDGSTVAAAKAVTFTVSGGADQTTYALTVTVATDSTPAQTMARVLTLKVADA